MRDEIYDREFQAARGTLFNDFRLLGQAIASSLNALHRFNFDAPWRHEPREHKTC